MYLPPRELLPVLGPCERYITPTLDAALLISSRVALQASGSLCVTSAPYHMYSFGESTSCSSHIIFLCFIVHVGALFIVIRQTIILTVHNRSFFPILFQFHSHQIFHCFVIAGAFVHYHGISLMALYRLRAGECPLPPIDKECLITA